MIIVVQERSSSDNWPAGDRL